MTEETQSSLSASQLQFNRHSSSATKLAACVIHASSLWPSVSVKARWQQVYNVGTALAESASLNYPVLLKPSYSVYLQDCELLLDLGVMAFVLYSVTFLNDKFLLFSCLGFFSLSASFFCCSLFADFIFCSYMSLSLDHLNQLLITVIILNVSKKKKKKKISVF